MTLLDRYNNPFVPGVSGGIRKAKAPLSELYGDGERGGKRGGAKGGKGDRAAKGGGGDGRCVPSCRDAWWPFCIAVCLHAALFLRAQAGGRGGGGPSPSAMCFGAQRWQGPPRWKREV